METDMRLQKLRKFNIIMMFLHLMQGIAVVVLSTDFKLPINTNYLSFDTNTQSLVLRSVELWQIPLGWLVAGFLFISAFAHFSIATWYNKKYNENLTKGLNSARWWEYSISASVMMVAISMLVGIYDLGSLIMIFSLVGIMNLLGLVMEVHNQTTQKTNWLSYNLGVFAGAIPWIIVALFFWSANKYGAGDIPTFVYWIYVSIFVFFNCFAINMILHYKKVGKWADYIYNERAYIILSLIAKSLLAWQVFAGTLQPV